MAKNLISQLPSTLGSNILRLGEEVSSSKPSKDMHPRPRLGKTAKDRQNKAHATNADNKATRASWQQDSKATTANFPYTTCNGKRNRTRIDRTRKGNLRWTYK